MDSHRRTPQPIDHRRVRPGAVIAVALLVLATLAGCSSDGDDDAFGTTTTAESGTTTTESGDDTTTTGSGSGDATMEPADGWTEATGSQLPTGVISAYGAPESSGGFTDNVNLLVEEGKADDLDEYWEASEQGLATLDDAEDVEPKSDTEMGGHPAYQKVWTTASQGQPLQFWSVLTAVDGNGYVFTYTATPDTFEDHRADAEEMFDSIQIPG